MITPALLATIVAAIPDDWLIEHPVFAGHDAEDQHRRAYVDFLMQRLRVPRHFTDEAVRARAHLA